MNRATRPTEDPNAELTRLLELLQETLQRILTLTDGHVDAVVSASGRLSLLPETPAYFRDRAMACRAFAGERNAILDALPAQVALLNPSGQIRAVNAAWLAFAGEQNGIAGFAVGESYCDFWETENVFGDMDNASVVSVVAAVLNGEQPQFQCEGCIPALPSRPWFRLVVAPLADTVEKGAVVMHIDITGQKAMEEQIRQMQRLDALGQLTGGVAHDFNNLLTVIMGNGEALVDSLECDEPRRICAELIVMAAERGAALTNRLLTFARRQALVPERVEVRALLASVAMLLGRTIGEHVTIRLPSGTDPYYAFVDRSQLENTIINLCLNARDAMPEGGLISIGIDSADVTAADTPPTPDLQPGRYVALTVSDKGCGMDDATMARTFEPFFTTKQPGKGSGLGLSVAYGFVRQSSGAVSIVSKVGVGTDVRIWLPRADISTPPVRDRDVVYPRGAGERRILPAKDDEPVNSHVGQFNCGLSVYSLPTGSLRHAPSEGRRRRRR